MIVFGGDIKTFSNINKPYKSFSRIVRGYQSKHNNEFESAKSKIVCTLFKQPLSNNHHICGYFFRKWRNSRNI